MKVRKFKYILGDSKREEGRLKRQAKLWDPITHKLFDRIGIKRGWKILELGPGRGSLHLELRRRVKGPIDAVERSPVFAAKLAKRCKKDGLGEGKIWNEDLRAVSLPKNHYDFIFARWVFLFLPNPLESLRILVRALKPGGVIAIQDYHRDTFGMIPAPAHWEEFLASDYAFFASQGGNVSVGSKLPEYFRQSGVKVTEIHPTILTGHPGSAPWKWATEYFFGVMDRQAKFPPFTPVKACELMKQWKKNEKDSSALFIAPAVLDVVGKKKR